MSKKKHLRAKLQSTYRFTSREVEILARIYPDIEWLLGKLDENPYLPVHILDSYSFSRMKNVEQNLGLAGDGVLRCAAALIHSLRRNEEGEGHCWMDYKEMVAMAAEAMGKSETSVKNTLAEALTSLIANEEVIRLEEDRNVVARKITLDKEKFIAEVLAFAHAERTSLPESFISTDMSALTEAQIQAVKMALQYKKSLISGKAGTGKSFVISALVNILRNQSLSYQMCAPTGKAARRLEEVSGEEAVTVHRLLGYDGVFFKDTTISADYVIVDEVSMMHTDLMFHLLSKIDFSRSSILLVGDHNQLPPVGCGNPLRDIIADSFFPKTILTDVVRQAGTLKLNCTNILDGNVSFTNTDVDGIPEWHVEADLDTPESINTRIEHFLDEELEKYGYHVVADTQILIPRKTGKAGVEEVNFLAQRLIQKKLYGNVIPEAVADRQPFYVGDKVIQTRNNYRLGSNGIMNGSIGLIQAMKDGEMLVSFEEETVKISGTSVKDLSLAYALTVHKTQGSEFPAVIFILHSGHQWKLHHRNLFYTAATRAQNSLFLLGSRKSIDKCASVEEKDRRKTFLADFLEAERSVNGTLTSSLKSNETGCKEHSASPAMQVWSDTCSQTFQTFAEIWSQNARKHSQKYAHSIVNQILAKQPVDSKKAANLKNMLAEKIENYLLANHENVSQFVTKKGIHKTSTWIESEMEIQIQNIVTEVLSSFNKL